MTLALAIVLYINRNFLRQNWQVFKNKVQRGKKLLFSSLNINCRLRKYKLLCWAFRPTAFVFLIFMLIFGTGRPCQILGYHGGDYEDYSLLGCDAGYSSVPTIHRTWPPPSLQSCSPVTDDVIFINCNRVCTVDRTLAHK
jgi:hypothetical protein